VPRTDTLGSGWLAVDDAALQQGTELDAWPGIHDNVLAAVRAML